MNILVLVFFLFSGGAQWAYSANNEIIHVQRSLSMGEDDPVYKDFYINMGKSSGLKENMVVNVTRIVHVGKGGKAIDGMKIEVPVGQLKIIYVQLEMAVARLYSSQDIEKTPTLETPAILIGDTIDLKDAFMDIKKQAVKPKIKEVIKENAKEDLKESSNEENNSLPKENAGT
jgi:hypothetical protein